MMKKIWSWIFGGSTTSSSDKQNDNGHGDNEVKNVPWRRTAIKGWSDEEAELFRERVTKYKDRDYNIAIVGLSGQGKSSFVNAVYSALQGALKNPAEAQPSTREPVTKQLYSFRLRSGTGRDEETYWRLKLLDTQGYGSADEQYRYNIEVFHHIIKTGKWLAEQEEGDDTVKDRPVNAAILCVHYRKRFVELQDQQFTEEAIKFIATSNIPVFLMITQIDTAKPEEETFQLETIFEDKTFQTAVEDASRCLRIDKCKILLQFNYSGNDQTTNAKQDLLTLYNLWFVLNTIDY